MSQSPLTPDVLAAAEAGDADAQCEVGIWHARHGAADHVREAETWLLRARARGSDRATYNLGVLSQNDHRETAAKYFEEAAGNGYVLAMRALGYLHWTSGDPKAAWPWLSKAAEFNDAPAKYAVAQIVVDSELESGYELAYRMATQAAESGSPEAQALLATMYHEGLGVQRSPPDAVYWWQRAAFNGHAGGQAMLGLTYHTGIVFEKDLVQAAHWMMRACRQGNEIANAYWKSLSNELSDEQYSQAMALVRRPLQSAEPPNAA